jgi:SAM-dependent methyltransferase
MSSSTETRSFEQIKRHYELEKTLANRLRQATQSERQKLYGKVYSELRQEFSSDSSAAYNDEVFQAKRAASQIPFLRKFLYPEAVFLEIGSSSCRTAIKVAKLVRKVYALDVSFDGVDKFSLPGNLECIESDGLHIPVARESIDIAYSHQVMEHIHPDDALDQLRAIYSVLGPGSKYICITPNRLNGPHDESKNFDEIATGMHLKEYTITELIALFRDAGFSHVVPYTGARGCYFPVPKLCFKLLEAVLTAFPHRFRVALGCRFPLRPLLAIRIVGIKV